MTPYVQLPVTSTSIVLEGLPIWTDHYFAVVPVDVLGDFDPIVIMFVVKPFRAVIVLSRW